MIEKKSAVFHKNVKLIAVSGQMSNEAVQLLIKILRTCNFRASNLNTQESAWEEALNIAGKVCDFVVLDTESFDVNFPEKFIPEAALVVGKFDSIINENDFKRFEHVVLPYSLSESIAQKGKNIIFYSMNSNEADLIAKNINPQEDRTVFELLGTGVIGRVKLSKKSGFSVELVLAVSSALVAMGVPLASVLGVMNQL